MIIQHNEKLVRQTVSLNGMWSIAGSGSPQEVPTAHAVPIPVPSVVDCTLKPYDWRAHSYHHHTRAFTLNGVPASRLCILEIQQAMFGTTVLLNGAEVGSSYHCYTSHRHVLNDALAASGENALRVVIGDRETLPPERPVGRDQERSEFIPGIWGDVNLILCGNPFIETVQVIPNLRDEVAEFRVFLRNHSSAAVHCDLTTVVDAHSEGGPAASGHASGVIVPAHGEAIAAVMHRIKHPHAWSPSDPFLYGARVRVSVAGEARDEWSGRFGMREFEIRGKQFFLNGKPIALRGGNIAFHRFLGDDQRQLLPWDMPWVKRAFVEIPKAHYFNFFRFHLGHAYNRWYDLADEHGMLLQDEWPFWNATGSNAAIREEFRRWILDNANHPSIVIWDPLNESTDDSVVYDIIPEMKRLDPTRPWESVDFHEQHPYIYSLGMTRNLRTVGYTNALTALERSAEPVVVNEFLWWWFDAEWNSTVLMKDVVERWLGRSHTKQQIIEHQRYLAEELVGLFRRMGCAAIQPFVYISNNKGPTANWFEGPIANLKPKPLLEELKNAYAPFGISIDLADRHFMAGDNVPVDLHLFNDTERPATGTITIGVYRQDELMHEAAGFELDLKEHSHAVKSVDVRMPVQPGEYRLSAQLREKGKQNEVLSRRILHVFPRAAVRRTDARPLIVLDPLGEVATSLGVNAVSFAAFENHRLQPDQLLFVNTFGLQCDSYRDRLDEVTAFVQGGGVLVIQEPEFRTVEPRVLRVTHRLTLTIERRHDVDKGGYDSYVFPEDAVHALWHDLRPEHLRWFNGAPGGELVSEHTIAATMQAETLASCGLGLRTPAVFRVQHGKGTVVVSRIQIRGRLSVEVHSTDRYARRFDPVAVRYLLNLTAL
ncbi:MAG: hypothetical protein MUF82_03750 [Bacteroidetes bacterium]|nr:hypothetical protein [Bacteroidota bacterium]